MKNDQLISCAGLNRRKIRDSLLSTHSDSQYGFLEALDSPCQSMDC